MNHPRCGVLGVNIRYSPTGLFWGVTRSKVGFFHLQRACVERFVLSLQGLSSLPEAGRWWHVSRPVEVSSTQPEVLGHQVGAALAHLYVGLTSATRDQVFKLPAVLGSLEVLPLGNA